jgi:hypothetical protein
MKTIYTLLNLNVKILENEFNVISFQISNKVRLSISWVFIKIYLYYSIWLGKSLNSFTCLFQIIKGRTIDKKNTNIQ